MPRSAPKLEAMATADPHVVTTGLDCDGKLLGHAGVAIAVGVANAGTEPVTWSEL